MNIFSDATLDVRNDKKQPGSYEWWYFDAVSSDGKYNFVVIFYEGNPFSTRYNRALTDDEKAPMPHHYPAISISIYEGSDPIYYSFTEFEETDCVFGTDYPRVEIGPHQMIGKMDEDALKYTLDLIENLPNGDSIEASIKFKSPAIEKSLFTNAEMNKSVGHQWNLVQPRAEVNGKIQLSAQNEEKRKIEFEGHGYHDHNTGHEPMRNEFRDWYWGRFHFDDFTLVYYVMNRQQTDQHRAWLISNSNDRVLDVFDDFELLDKGLTLFGLHTARKINLKSPNTETQIQQSVLLDNGPFYQRFMSHAFLQISGEHIMESVSGITEYLYPSRIYSRLFWPFVDMRIRYMTEGPHWVQRSKMLYRWTW